MQYDNFDLVIIYRAYPGISKVPIVKNMSKLESVLTNILSIKRSTGSLNVKYLIILDRCELEYKKYISEILNDCNLVFYEVDFGSGEKTFELQLKLTDMFEDEQNILMLEDDYIMNNHCLSNLVAFLKEQPDSFCTPFYSTDYDLLDFHKYQREIISVQDCKWRKVSCTTLTFCAKVKTIRKYRSIFLSFLRGNNDSSIWMAITKILNVRITLKGDLKLYFLKKYFKLAWFIGFNYFFTKVAALYADVGSSATHLESTNCALNTEKLISENEKVKIVDNKLYVSK